MIVNSQNTVLGSARRPTPTEGGPEDVAERDDRRRVREAAEAADVETADLRGVGVGSPGVDRPRHGGGLDARATSPDWEGTFELGEALSKGLARRCSLATTCRWPPTREFKLGAGKPYKSVLGVFWGTGVGGGLMLNGKPWIGRGGAGEIGHMVVKIGGASARAGGAGAWRHTPGAARWRHARGRRHDEGNKTDLFKLMKEHERTRLTSSIWARALDNGDKLATELIDEAVEALGAGVASASTCSMSRPWSSAAGSGSASATRWPSGSARRCIRICSTTPSRPTCTWPRSATSAARSARHCRHFSVLASPADRR